MPKCQGNSITPLITYSSKENEIVFKNINTVSKKFTQQTRLQLKLQRKLEKPLIQASLPVAFLSTWEKLLILLIMISYQLDLKIMVSVAHQSYGLDLI